MIGKEILNYRIVSLIGKGGMGSVYLGEHKFISKQKAAIKVINADMVNEFTKKCLKEEAEHLAGLNHHNIVAFHDYDIDEKGNIYLVMEYADGKSLEDYINTVSGLIVEEKICPLFEPILDAVGYAHKHNIIHRDIKPSNIIITTDGTPKILDFGIATIIKKEEEDKDHLIMGTPSYMSPEQVKGEHLDERSDIYSLGVLLHQMLTGNAPYDTTTLTEFDINKKVIEEPLPRLKTYYKYVSEKVQKVVDKATAKNPEDRYQSCAEFKKALHLAIYPPKVSKWIWTSVAACIALIIGAGIYYWDYNRTKVYYYKDYAEQWGVPQGIGELNEREVGHREASYRFEYSKGRLRRMSYVNSSGKITTHHDSEHMERPSDLQLFYADNNKLDYTKVLDQYGKVLYKMDYNDKLNTVIFQYDDEYGTELTLASDVLKLFSNPANNDENKGRISRYLLTYDEHGYVSKLEYAAIYNIAVSDKDGIFGRQYIRDNKGRVIEEHYLGYDGNAKSTSFGLGIKQNKYDEKDNWIETRYLTIDKEEGTDGNGVPIVTIDVDKYGNRIKETYTNFKGELTYRDDAGCCGFIYTRNDKGQYTELTSFGADNQPCYSKNGAVKCIYEYDQNGWITKQTFYDADNHICMSSYNYAFITLENNNCGKVTEAWEYDENGKLVDSKDGSGFKCEYDSIGNQIKYVAYNNNREPFINENGIIGYTMKYNDKNLVIEQINLGKGMKVCKDNNGVAIIKIQYDKKGNKTQIAYYDIDGKKRAMSTYGYAGWNNVYDENGNRIEYNNFNTENKICMSNEYHAKCKMTYDEQGNMKSIRYYDTKDVLTLVNGIAGTDYIRDKRGNILESRDIGLDSKLAKNKLVIKYKYDKFDNVIESSVYNSNEEPALNGWNVHKWTAKYNSRKQVTEQRYYNTKGNLTLYNNKNYAIEKNEYDNKGNRIRCFLYGTDSKPTLCDEGWSSSTYEYDAFGHITKQCFYGVDRKPTDPKVMVPVGICKYDKWGNMIYIAAQDGHGSFITNPNTGWAISRMTYDRKSNVTSYAYFNDNDKPVLCKEGYHKVTYAYNNSDKKTEECYFGTDSKPMLINNVHKIKYEYDSNGYETLEAFYGKDGKPVNAASGYHKYVVTYDANGTADMAKFYLANGKLYGSMKWNGEKWVVTNSPNTSTTTSPSQNWQSRVAELNTELPTSFNNDDYTLYIQSIKVTGESSCETVFKISVSKYELNETQLSELNTIITEYASMLKKELGRGVTVTCVLYDSKGRNIYTTRK